MRRLHLLPFFQSLTLLTLSFHACKDEGTPPPLHVSTVQLSVEDVSCTEAWLKVSLTDASEPRTVAIRQEGQCVLTVRLSSSDSVLVVEGLLPKRSYSYTAVRLRDSTVIETSSPAQLTTLDSTSHEFTFQLDTLGIGLSNRLWDVTLVNDTLAYAVGEMHLTDSVGQIDPIAYNAAKWNGFRWELKRIPFIGPCSAVDYPELTSVWAFSENNILFTNGGSIVRFDGANAVIDCRMSPLLVGAINKLQANDPVNVYAVGNSGAIVHYANGGWQRIESGTNVTLNDAWGGINRWVGENVLLVAASNILQGGEMKLLRLSGALVDTVAWPMQDRRIHSVWFDRHSRVYTAGGGVFEYRGGSQWREITEVPLVFTTRIRGTGPNDIFVVGDYGAAAHFNGVTWRVYPEVRLQGNYESLAVRNNVILAVGWSGSRAIILRGTRTLH